MVVSNNGLLEVPLLFKGVIPGCLFDGSKQNRIMGLDKVRKMDVPGMSPLRCGRMTLPCFGFSFGFLANEGEPCGVTAVYVCSISTFSCGGSLIFCGLPLLHK